MQYEVAVVGGGMAGLACALGLIKEGFKLAVIEAKSCVNSFNLNQPIKRVSAINPASEGLLQSLGVWQGIVNARSNDYVAMEIWDQNTSAELKLHAHAFSLANLGVIVENDLIVAKLYQSLHDTSATIFECAEINQITQLNGKNRIELVDGDVIECALIVGADGASSFTRELFGFSHSQKPYQQHAIVANMKTEKCHQSVAYQRFLSNGVLAFLPLSQPDLCSIVYSVNNDCWNDILAFNEEAFNEHLYITSGGRLGRLELKSPRMSFELIERHVDYYCQNGVVLIADAAHTIHPLAGQGINLGFADVKALIDTLVQAKKQQRNIADLSTLVKYEQKRRVENQIMLEMMKRLKQLFCNDSFWVKPLRELGMNAINQSNLLKRFLIEQATGL